MFNPNAHRQGGAQHLLFLLTAVGAGACLSPTPMALDVGVDVPIADAPPELDVGRGDAGADATRVADARVMDTAVADVFDASSDVTFTAVIYPLLETVGCTTPSCHGSPVQEISPDGAGLLLYLGSADQAWLEMSLRSLTSTRQFVVPGDPEGSELILHARDTNVPAGILTESQLQILERWVADGAERGAEPPRRVRLAEPDTCSLQQFGVPPLPSACLPRCTVDTWQRVVDCRSASDPFECQQAAIARDSIPAVELSSNFPRPIDCGECLTHQTESCFFQVCRTEYLAQLRCLVSGGVCTTERTRLEFCATETSRTAFLECRTERDELCVDAK